MKMYSHRLIALMLLVGCNHDIRPQHPHSLEGTRWQLVDWPIESQDAKSFDITAEFTEGSIQGSSGCNSYGAAYFVTADGQFKMGMLVSTLVNCFERKNSAEIAYQDQLKKSKRFSVEEKLLTLFDEAGKTLVFRQR